MEQNKVYELHLRAQKYASDFTDHHEYSIARTAYILSGYRQDYLSRKDERERCIVIAQEQCCKMCNGYERYCCDYQKASKIDHTLPNINFKCTKLEQIRESIEKGGNNGNN